MELLWEQGKPLSRSEIILLSTERTWQASSIHILLNQLLEKGAIVVDGFVKTGKNYGRTFAATVTQGEYEATQLKKSVASFKLKPSALGDFVSALFQDEELDEATLDRLDAILKSKRNKKE